MNFKPCINEHIFSIHKCYENSLRVYRGPKNKLAYYIDKKRYEDYMQIIKLDEPKKDLVIPICIESNFTQKTITGLIFDLIYHYKKDEKIETLPLSDIEYYIENMQVKKAFCNIDTMKKINEKRYAFKGIDFFVSEYISKDEIIFSPSEQCLGYMAYNEAGRGLALANPQLLQFAKLEKETIDFFDMIEL